MRSWLPHIICFVTLTKKGNISKRSLLKNIRYGNTLSIQGIPAFRDFTIRDPRYFVILFSEKLAKIVDFSKILKVRLLVRSLLVQFYFLKTVIFFLISKLF